MQGSNIIQTIKEVVDSNRRFNTGYSLDIFSISLCTVKDATIFDLYEGQDMEKINFIVSQARKFWADDSLIQQAFDIKCTKGKREVEKFLVKHGLDMQVIENIKYFLCGLDWDYEEELPYLEFQIKKPGDNQPLDSYAFYLQEQELKILAERLVENNVQVLWPHKVFTTFYSTQDQNGKVVFVKP